MLVETICDNGKVGRKETIIVNEEDMGECVPGYMGADILSHYFRTDRNPDVVYTVSGADFFSVIQRGGRVAIGEDEY